MELKKEIENNTRSYDYDFGFVNKQDYKLNFRQETIELVIYSAICFFVPFLLGHPQWVVGVLVNAALVLAALNLRSYMILPVILIPSLAVLSRGMIFGPFTPLLIFMIPFIWIGNSILVYTFKKLFVEKKMNRFLVLGIGAAAKTMFLFGLAFIFFKLGVLPAIFLTTMGLLQLYTAVAGGLLALGIHEIKKKFA